MPNFLTIDYLKHGTPLQIRAYQVLIENEVMSQIASYHPVLVGTIPIDIAIENSDLDIICYWKNKKEFIEKLQLCFGKHPSFSIRELSLDGEETVVANFLLEEFEIEIFGQDKPTEEQNGYKHMIIEHEILTKKGASFRQEIIQLKQSGYKTEPAFALLLGLEGNPYLALLKYTLSNSY